MSKTTPQSPLSSDEASFRFVRHISPRSAWFLIIGVICVLAAAAYLYQRGKQYGEGDARDEAFPSHMQNIQR